MILQQQLPPPVNGTADDTARLSSWCASFAQRLKHTLINLDDSNITGMSAAKLDSGTVSLDRVALDGTSVSADAHSVTVRSGDSIIFSVNDSGSLYIGGPGGSQYVRLDGDSLSICADTIVCNSIETKE